MWRQAWDNDARFPTLVGKRQTNCTVDGVAGFGRLVPGGPGAGREFSDSIDRKIG